MQFLWFVVNTYAYPTFELSNAVLLLPKLLLESESWGCVSNPLRFVISFLYLSWQLHQIKAWVRMDQVVLRYAYDEWSSVTSTGLLIIGLSNLTSQQEVVQAEMLSHCKKKWVVFEPFWLSQFYIFPCHIRSKQSILPWHLLMFWKLWSLLEWKQAVGLRRI